MPGVGKWHHEPHKKTLPRPQGLVGAAGKVHRGLSGAWELQGSVWGVLASFEAWQTAALNLLKRTLPRPQGLVGAAGKVCRGLSGAWELQGRVWVVLASFEGWQTAALNLFTATASGTCWNCTGSAAACCVWERRRNRECCMSGPWEVDRNCCGLSGSWAVNRECYKRLGSFGEL